MSKILVVGATSAIAEACLRIWARRGDRLFLAARDATHLKTIADDLRIRGAASVDSAPFDALDYATHEPLFQQATEAMGGLDIVLVAHGSLPDGVACEADSALALREIGINAVSAVLLLNIAARQLRAAGSGRIAAISSVAGDRGRGSNYLYGASKAMLTTYLAGLRHSLYGSGVTVTAIKPGIIASPMTADLPRGPLMSTPAAIAPSIVRAIDGGRGVVYVPGFWRLVMLIIRNLPDAIFLRTKL